MRNQIYAGAVAIFLVCTASLAVKAQQDNSQRRPVLNFVGVTGHAWGTWVHPGVEVEDWGEEARGFCAPEEFCEVNVFEGAEFATHEYPVPEVNRGALKWVFVYRQYEIPRIVIEEAHEDPARERRRWVVDK